MATINWERLNDQLNYTMRTLRGLQDAIDAELRAQQQPQTVTLTADEYRRLTLGDTMIDKPLSTLDPNALPPVDPAAGSDDRAAATAKQSAALGNTDSATVAKASKG